VDDPHHVVQVALAPEGERNAVRAVFRRVRAGARLMPASLPPVTELVYEYPAIGAMFEDRAPAGVLEPLALLGHQVRPGGDLDGVALGNEVPEGGGIAELDPGRGTQLVAFCIDALEERMAQLRPPGEHGRVRIWCRSRRSAHSRVDGQSRKQQPTAQCQYQGPPGGHEDCSHEHVPYFCSRTFRFLIRKA
jgi:hypothetical protein